MDLLDTASRDRDGRRQRKALLPEQPKKEILVNPMDNLHPGVPPPTVDAGRSWAGWALICFLAIAGFFLFTEHRAHFFGALPYLLLLACPLVHLLHHGHGGGHGHHGESGEGGAS